MDKLFSTEFIKTEFVEPKLSEPNVPPIEKTTEEHKSEVEDKDLQDSSISSLSDMYQEYDFKQAVLVSPIPSTKIQLMRIGGLPEESKKD